uniref:Uncharacterized protein n=1 Tax=Tanacetum cinerariifolium TaxID=118510 RepID=A0A6L2NE94_TANCI|nr:hypothetical protein [Tanacetum cinerariifolium]
MHLNAWTNLLEAKLLITVRVAWDILPEFVEPSVQSYRVKPIEVVIQKSSVKISAPVKENNDAPLIKDRESDEEDEVESPPEIERKTVASSADKVEVDIPKQNDKPTRRPVKYAEMLVQIPSEGKDVDENAPSGDHPLWNELVLLILHYGHCSFLWDNLDRTDPRTAKDGPGFLDGDNAKEMTTGSWLFSWGRRIRGLDGIFDELISQLNTHPGFLLLNPWNVHVPWISQMSCESTILYVCLTRKVIGFLKSGELGKECSCRAFKGVNGLVLLSLGEDASSKRFLLALARDLF